MIIFLCGLQIQIIGIEFKTYKHFNFSIIEFVQVCELPIQTMFYLRKKRLYSFCCAGSTNLNFLTYSSFITVSGEFDPIKRAIKCVTPVCESLSTQQISNNNSTNNNGTAISYSSVPIETIQSVFISIALDGQTFVNLSSTNSDNCSFHYFSLYSLHVNPSYMAMDGGRILIKVAGVHYPDNIM